jgi:hypothetical protein
LKDLPVHNQENFSLYNIDSGTRTSQMKRPSVYIPTVDIPAEQSKELHEYKHTHTNLDFSSHYHREKEHSPAVPPSDLGQEKRTKEARR